MPAPRSNRFRRLVILIVVLNVATVVLLVAAISGLGAADGSPAKSDGLPIAIGLAFLLTLALSGVAAAVLEGLAPIKGSEPEIILPEEERVPHGGSWAESRSDTRRIGPSVIRALLGLSAAMLAGTALLVALPRPNEGASLASPGLLASPSASPAGASAQPSAAVTLEPATPRPSTVAVGSLSATGLPPCPKIRHCGLYTVRADDYLYAIARAFDVPFAKVVSLNPEIDNLSLIHAGDKVRIPR